MPVEVVQTPYIKLIRNPKGVYHWEIKVLNHDLDAIYKVDSELRLRFNNNQELKGGESE